MRIILFLIQKEFLQVFRNRTMLPMIFVLPVVQLVILVNAATLEMKKIDTIVVDQDLSSTSRELISKFEGSPFFNLHESAISLDDAEDQLMNNTADLIIYLPAQFEKHLMREGKSGMQLVVNAIDGTAAGLINVYTTHIINDYNKSVATEWIRIDTDEVKQPIQIQSRFWYNPTLEYRIYMLPGILVILITLIGMFLSAMNIVREKEMGTIEQINVTPIKKYQFIIGKMAPFLIIALFELSLGLTVGVVFFHEPVEGSLVVLFTTAFVYLLVCLGLGLFFSAISDTQQQVMFTLYFFLLVFILMSGIFTPTDNMPQWAHWINIINPFSYFMKAIRMILLKGSGFAEIADILMSLGIYAVLINSLAVWRYRKTI